MKTVILLFLFSVVPSRWIPCGSTLFTARLKLTLAEQVNVSAGECMSLCQNSSLHVIVDVYRPVLQPETHSLFVFAHTGKHTLTDKYNIGIVRDFIAFEILVL